LHFRDISFLGQEHVDIINPARVYTHCVVDGDSRMIIDYLDADIEHLEFM